jgi:CHAT domain-containing protein
MALKSLYGMLFGNKPRRWLLLFLLIVLLVLGLRPSIAKSLNPDDLTAEGHRLLAAEQPQAAIQIWRQALKIYQSQQNQEAVVGTHLNLSNAEQALQRYDLACNTLYTAYATLLKENLCQTTTQPNQVSQLPQLLANQPLALPMLENWGQVYLYLGRVDLGQALLQSLHERYPKAEGVRLNLANAKVWQIRQALARYQATQNDQARLPLVVTMQTNLAQATQQYQALARSDSPWMSRVAQLNEVGMLSLIANWQDRPPEIPYAADRLNQLIQITSHQELAGFTPIQAWNYRLRLAEFLARGGDPRWRSTALALGKTLLEQAQTQQSIRRNTRAGLLVGQLHLQTNQLAQAESTLNHALTKAQHLGDQGLLFQAHWALAQTYEQQRQQNQELVHLKAAVSAADRLTPGYLWASPFVQNIFSSQIEPAYRKLISQLLELPQPDIRQSLSVFEKFSQIQIEAYLGCGRLNLQSLSSVIDTRGSENLGVIYLLASETKIHIVVRDGQGKYHLHSTPLKGVKSHLNALMLNLRGGEVWALKESILLRDSQALYSLLLKPLAQKLPHNGNLVFVMDTSLQGLPLGLLHTGQHFLIEDYALSISTPQTRIPKSLKLDQMQALIAGIYQNSPTFVANGLPPLPGIAAEITATQKIFPNHFILKNEKFTVSDLKQFAAQGFPIVHLATHGLFAGDPANTVLFAWDKPISLEQIQEVLRISASTAKEPPMELLVLSGCELAYGDRDAALGLAGVGIQAGARATLASLWQVDDASTTRFIQSFYEAIAGGQPKARALQTAQLDLLRSGTNSHPFYWAGWSLLGSWL